MNWNLLAQTTQQATKLAGDTFWLPPGVSTISRDTDWLLQLINWITIFFTLLIVGLLVGFVVKYRHKPGQKPKPTAGHSTALELTWTLIPTVIVVVVFYFGFRQYLDMTVVPPNTYEIQADAAMWNWNFTYPNGFSSDELHVPEGVPVRVVLTSKDVIHALFIPALRLQKSNVPGRYNKLWFQAKFENPTAAGGMMANGKPYTEMYDIYCNQYCGTSHAEMRSTLTIHRKEDYEAFMADFSDWTKAYKAGKIKPTEQGEKIYRSRGCAACHSVDGTSGTGPSWKDLFGRKATYDGGTAYAADENYIRESIFEPDKHIVDGFKPAMPVYKGALKDYDVDAVIAFMKTISKNYSGDANKDFKLPGDKSGAASSSAAGGASSDKKDPPANDNKEEKK